MSNYLLNIFATVAECGSFVRAADELKLTASAISHAIGGLESECGFPLFIRSKYGVTLTENGRRLLPLVHDCLATNERLSQEINQLNHVNTGIIRIAAIHSVSVEWLPGILQRFYEKNPNIEVKIYRGNYKDIVDMLDENRIDLGITVETVVGDRSFIPLKTEPLVCVTPRSFVPRNRTYITPEEINENKLMTQDQAGNFEAENYIRKHGLKVHTYLRIDDDNMVMALVDKGLGISIIPELAANTGKYDLGIYRLKPDLTRTLGIVMGNPKSASPAAKLMKQAIMDYLQE